MSTLKWMESVNCMLAKELIEQRKDRDIARGERDQMRKERDEALEALKQIEEYGTKEINAAVTLRQELAKALLERDEARMGLNEALDSWNEAIEQRDEAMNALQWIAGAYCHEKSTFQLAQRAYEMSSKARWTIQKIVQKEEAE